MQSLPQNPTDDGFVQNPYGFYGSVRGCGDLFYWPDYDRICVLQISPATPTNTNFTGFTHCRSQLPDFRFFFVKISPPEASTLQPSAPFQTSAAKYRPHTDLALSLKYRQFG